MFERLSERLAGAIRWAAGATFTLYLFHMPILLFVAALLPWRPDAPAMRLALFVVPLVAVFVIAEGTERQKTAWRRAIAALLARARPAAASLLPPASR